MTKSVEDESTEVVLEARAPRPGLGAAVPRQFHFTPSNDPLERKLRAKLIADKRKVAKSAEEDEILDEDSADEETESRKCFFEKESSQPDIIFTGKEKAKSEILSAKSNCLVDIVFPLLLC
ncbi:hypothetical protein RJ639_019770 [Escallonia herrerae]|uniref:Uncharacterized protein n=1 Tax=Escallonia herrerae TaxID=1293975 RepID=A0AA88V8X7_9ASTE|nr:hypothetical protein RJ639_019770 [Escallonia herrerae]